MSQYGAYGLAQHGKSFSQHPAPLLPPHLDRHDRRRPREGPAHVRPVLGRLLGAPRKPAGARSPRTSSTRSRSRVRASRSSTTRATRSIVRRQGQRLGWGVDCGVRAGDLPGQARRRLVERRPAGRSIACRSTTTRAASCPTRCPRAGRGRRSRRRPWPAAPTRSPPASRAPSTSTTTPAARSTAARAPSSPPPTRPFGRPRAWSSRAASGSPRPTSSRPPAGIRRTSRTPSSARPGRATSRACAIPTTASRPTTSGRCACQKSTVASALSGLYSGKLKKIRVLKRGTSPRIVYARVVGSAGSTKVTGDTLKARLGALDSWMSFGKHETRSAGERRRGRASPPRRQQRRRRQRRDGAGKRRHRRRRQGRGAWRAHEARPSRPTLTRWGQTPLGTLPSHWGQTPL